MLMLGEKYTFTKLEKQRLEKKLINYSTISYRNKNPDSVIIDIKTHLDKDKFTMIVLNTREKVDDIIIKFLTNLKYNENYKKIKIYTIEHFLEKFLHKCYIPEDQSDLHYLNDIKPFSTWQYIQKRAIDYFGIFWLLLCSFYVMKKCKKKILEESPGPIYFYQTRVGLNNKEFTCIKFRSMNLNVVVKHMNRFTSENDPRVFSWGKKMRRRRYDELPQLKNILNNEMHLIGPRAEWNKLVNDYEKDIPYYNLRHIVRPGITGWAQVMYPYGKSAYDAKQKLMYDLYYIKHWSFLLELKIVWKTANIVLKKEGI